MRAHLFILLAVAACGDNSAGDDQPVDPSGAAAYRGYAAVQDELYAKFVADGQPFELFDYLGTNGDDLSKLVGRPDGFGAGFEPGATTPNAMNVLVWRMMLRAFAHDLAASCPQSSLTPVSLHADALSATAQPVVLGECAWPASDQAAGAAWDYVVGVRAPTASRAAFIQMVHGLSTSETANDGIADLWTAALLHPSFLLEQ